MSFFKRQIDGWSISSTFLAFVLLAPLATIILGVFETGPEWRHIVSTVLPDYLANTILLVLGTSVFSILFALPTAWVVATYEFPGRYFLQWALILPLAVPSFTCAFIYFDVLEWTIPLLIKVRSIWGINAAQVFEKCVRYGTLMLLLSSVLYPYLYLCLRTAFSRQQTVYFEAARVLGSETRQIFWRIALPLARPAMVAGLSLIIMEVINDYGAVHFFGVPTLTEGVFRTWFGLSDKASGLRLAMIIMSLVFILLFFDFWQRHRSRFVEGAQSSKPHVRLQLGKRQTLWVLFLCCLPVTLGFLLPVIRLFHWAWIAKDTFDFERFFSQLGNSLFLAAGTSLSLGLLAFFFAYNVQTLNSSKASQFIRSSTLGYAIPSVVTGVGVMMLLGIMDRCMGSVSWLPTLSGSLFAISFAYSVRFLTVAYQPINAGVNAVCSSLHEASMVLGQSKMRSMVQVHWPLLRLQFLAGVTLVFIDITKELPLTLVLRPSNFETLATFAFGFAKEGQIYDSAFPSLLIIGLGIAGIFVVNRYSRRLYL